MLKGISKYISPELLALLHRMGHGDEILLADAHFPGHSSGPQTLRADGITVAQLLDGILPLFELDSYAPPLIMMQAAPSDRLDPGVERDYMEIIRKHVPNAPSPERIERFALLRARPACACDRDDRRAAQIRKLNPEKGRYPGGLIQILTTSFRIDVCRIAHVTAVQKQTFTSEANVHAPVMFRYNLGTRPVIRAINIEEFFHS